MLKRKAPAETERKKKISLPAAIFNRSPLKNAQNSSLISNTSFHNEPPCENHPNKKGKYSVVSEEIQEDQQTFYCEKCAILLASKGFEVKKLEIPDVKATEKKKLNPRQQELTSFIKNIEEQVKILKEQRKQSSEKFERIQQIYQGKLQKLDFFFEELHNTLQKHKNKQLHELSLKKKSTEEDITSYLGYTTQKIDLLQAMKQDILSSQEQIINSTPEEDYQLVMTHYQNNLSEIKVQPIVPALENQDEDLPSIQTIECTLAELFSGGESGTYFSFDSSCKKPYE